MREIKFRAWHNRDKIMATVGTLYWNGQVRVSYKKGTERPGYFFGGNNVGADWAKEDCDLMQYTGLRDKNGVDIYEGDVVKLTALMFRGYTPQGDEINENETWVTSIIYEGCGFCYGQYPEMYNGVSIGDMDEEIEVIGNIHQHPELIEQLNREEGK